jgi:predicted phage terminase large subunit-like protein
MPKFDFTVQSWDTSFGEYQRGDPSACVLWGVFSPAREPSMSRTSAAFGVMLIDAWEARVTFPELKEKALELYRQHRPDSLAIEARAAGSPLLQELQRMGLPVARYAPTSGRDKLTRLNAVSDLFRSGLCWYHESCPLADTVIRQCAEFPDGDRDDLMDASVQALQRVREGGWVRLDTDERGYDEDEKWAPPVPREAYY